MVEPLVMPLIHSNGTGRELLGQRIIDAIMALDKAYTTIDGTFHSRDYYLLGEEKSKLAVDQHLARLRKLKDVRAELVEIYDHVCTT